MEYKKISRAKNSPVINVVMSGVGGQGVLVASDVLTMAAMHAGLDTKKSEVHGMAQRGGSVISMIRYGEKIHSPLIEKGKADIILAFEKLEALRYLDMLKPGGAVIVNSQQITPLSVFFTKTPYPQDIEEVCRRKAEQVVIVDGIELAEEIGNPKVLNTIMLGALSNFLEFEPEDWLSAIEERVPPKTLEINRRAFDAGRNFR